MSLTSTSEEKKKLEDRIASLEEELRASDRARDGLLRLNDELNEKNKYLKAKIGILKRAIRVLNDGEED